MGKMMRNEPERLPGDFLETSERLPGYILLETSWIHSPGYLLTDRQELNAQGGQAPSNYTTVCHQCRTTGPHRQRPCPFFSSACLELPREFAHGYRNESVLIVKRSHIHSVATCQLT